MGPVTIYDVARRAGVSPATVSKVLSNTPYVSESTRERVLDVVRELDYVPSLAARSLSRSRTSILGLVFPYAPDYLFHDPHLMTFMLGADEAAAARDYSLLIFAAHSPADPAGGLRRLLKARFVDGAILVGTRSILATAADLRYRTYPTVTLGYESPYGSAHTVHADDRHGGMLAARHLLDLGHRRIGLISGPEEITAVTERIAGFRTVLAGHGVDVEPGLTSQGDFTFQSGCAAAERLLSMPDRPTAVFAVNDRMALGVMWCAQQHGLAVPGDLSVIGFDDIEAAAFSTPPLTTVRQPSSEMGRLAAQRVFDLLDHGKDGLESVVLPVTLVVRSSTCKLNGRR